MCIPAVPLLIASTAVSALGAGFSALQAHAQASYQAKIADHNAAMERESAVQAQENTREASLTQYRRMAQLKGAQIVGAAANGVSIDFGTAADSVSDTDMLGREDVNRIYKQGAQTVRGFDINAANYAAEANASRQAASGALVQGLFNVGSTVLGGASQYGALSAKLGGGLAQSAAGAIRSNPGIF